MWHVGSSPVSGQTHVPCIARWILNHWTSRGALLCSLLVTSCVLQIFIYFSLSKVSVTVSYLILPICEVWMDL